ncbi:MAG: hypothetical protein ABFS38_01035 [Bacteroidota bacterium]
MKTVKFFMIAILITSVTSTLSAQKKVDPTGTWTFQADEAPYGYTTGDMVIEKDGKEYTAKILFGEYYEVKASGVEYEKNEISFRVYIEGESISIKGTVGKESIDGTAIYSEGTISYKAKKKK